MSRGYCLVKQEIEQKIKGENPTILGREIDLSDDGQARMSSFEPRLDGEVFVLPPSAMEKFRPAQGQSVYRTLLELPRRERSSHTLDSGFTIAPGTSYLFRLREKVIPEEGQVVVSSPRSSFGRKFLNTRLLADFNPAFNEIDPRYSKAPLDLWLLVQPRAFSLTMYPDMRINQLRFISGVDAHLSDKEIADEIAMNPILFEPRGEGLTPITSPRILKGLYLHGDTTGSQSSGIFALRARPNPNPIDCRVKGSPKVEDYFDPMIAGIDEPRFEPRKAYLVASREYLKVPGHLSAELKAGHQVGLSGPLHFAGFADNKFEGYLVFEIIPEEVTGMRFTQAMPLSSLDVYRTNILPDRLYGDMNSSYQGQVGPMPSTYFKKFSWQDLARDHKTLAKEVLVQDKKVLSAFRNGSEGFAFLNPKQRDALEDIVKTGFYQERYDCEEDPLLQQLVSYLVVFGPEETVFTYHRSPEADKDRERRLLGRYSLGLGGHILKTDAHDPARAALTRKLEEEVSFKGGISAPVLAGTVMCSDEDVDRMHFGLVYVAFTNETPELKTPTHKEGVMRGIYALAAEYPTKKFENWSRHIIPHLPGLYAHSIQTLK